MNILYIYHAFTTVGGLERILIDKANYLAQELGHTVYIITFEQGKHPIVYPLSDKVIHIDLDVCFYQLYQYGRLKRLLMQQQKEKEFHHRLTEVVTRAKADIVICTCCDFITTKVMSRLKHPAVKIIENHVAKAYVEKGSPKEVNRIVRLGFKLRDRVLYKCVKNADAFVTLTVNDAKEWKPITETRVIPNMLTYYPPRTDEIKKLGKRVISAGRLTEQKGYDLLIKAWEIVHHTHPDWQLDIYGDGEDRATLEQEVKQRGLCHTITLHSPTTVIYEKYMESDFYVLSSRWEGFGLVLSEAMSCGIPCVSFNCPHGPSDIIKDNEDGFLVKNGDIEQLAKKICYLIEHEDIRRQMGQKARENVKRYLPINVMKEWEELFKLLVK